MLQNRGYDFNLQLIINVFEQGGKKFEIFMYLNAFFMYLNVIEKKWTLKKIKK